MLAPEIDLTRTSDLGGLPLRISATTGHSTLGADKMSSHTPSSASRVLELLVSGDEAFWKLTVLAAEEGFNVNEVDSSGLSPLKAAVISGNVRSVEALLNNGAVVSGELIEFAAIRYPHKPAAIEALRSAYARDAALDILNSI